MRQAQGSLSEVDTQWVRAKISPFNFTFSKFLRIDFQGSRVTSDGGLLLVRGLDGRLGLTGLIQNYLVDSRTGRNTQFPLADLFRQFAYGRLAGYEDLNDATRLASAPTFLLRRATLRARPTTKRRGKPKSKKGTFLMT